MPAPTISLSPEQLDAVKKGNGKVDFYDPGTDSKYTLFEIVQSPSLTDDDMRLILDEARAQIACGEAEPWADFIEKLRSRIANFTAEADSNC